jgi:hypothetical protein
MTRMWRRYRRVVAIPETITCVDCGGVSHRISYLSEDEPPEPGDVIAYRCADCHDRWDVVVDDADLDDDVPDERRR